MKKYLLLVQRRNPSGATYVARKTVYAETKTAAAKEFTQMLGKKVNTKYVIDVQKALAEREKELERIAQENAKAEKEAAEKDTEESKADISKSIQEEDSRIGKAGEEVYTELSNE